MKKFKSLYPDSPIVMGILFIVPSAGLISFVAGLVPDQYADLAIVSVFALYLVALVLPFHWRNIRRLTQTKNAMEPLPRGAAFDSQEATRWQEVSIHLAELTGNIRKTFQDYPILFGPVLIMIASALISFAKPLLWDWLAISGVMASIFWFGWIFRGIKYEGGN